MPYSPLLQFHSVDHSNRYCYVHDFAMAISHRQYRILGSQSQSTRHFGMEGCQKDQETWLGVEIPHSGVLACQFCTLMPQSSLDCCNRIRFGEWTRLLEAVDSLLRFLDRWYPLLVHIQSSCLLGRSLKSHIWSHRVLHSLSLHRVEQTR